MTIPSTEPLCVLCSRYAWGESVPADRPLGIAPVCTAFPDGIPEPVWFLDHDHQIPFAGDDGITFAPAAGVDPSMVHDVLTAAGLPSVPPKR